MNFEAPPIQREQSEKNSLAGFLGREFVSGGHLLALGTASIAAFCAMLLGKVPTVQLLAMAYLFSLGAYMVNRAVELDQDSISHPERTKHLKARRKYLPFIAGSCFAIGYILAISSGNFEFLLALLTPLILALAYSVGSKKLVKMIGVRRFKEKLLAKNIMVSFGWSLIPFLVGIYYSNLPEVLFLLAPFVFLRLLVNTIFFDVRDAKGDRKNGIRTIPVAFGRVRSFTIMDFLDLVCGTYIVSLVAFGALPFYTSIVIFFPLYSVFYRLTALRYPSKIGVLCDVFSDGEYLLWGPVLLFGSRIIV